MPETPLYVNPPDDSGVYLPAGISLEQVIELRDAVKARNGAYEIGHTKLIRVAEKRVRKALKPLSGLEGE